MVAKRAAEKVDSLVALMVDSWARMRGYSRASWTVDRMASTMVQMMEIRLVAQ